MTIISLSPGFLSLPASLMKKLVSSENLNISCNEEGVLKFVLEWVNHNLTNRLEHCPDVMKNVRLPLIPRNLLIKFLGSEFEELKKTGECHIFLESQEVPYCFMIVAKDICSCNRAALNNNNLAYRSFSMRLSLRICRLSYINFFSY